MNRFNKDRFQRERHYGDLNHQGSPVNRNSQDTKDPFFADAYHQNGEYDSGYNRYNSHTRFNQRETNDAYYDYVRSNYIPYSEREPLPLAKKNDYSDFMNYNYGYNDRINPAASDWQTNQEWQDQPNRGYNRGFGGYRNTGYGSTAFDNRDIDRERTVGYQHNRDIHDRGVPDFKIENHGDEYGAGRGDTYSSGFYDRSSNRHRENLIRNRGHEDRYASESDRGGYTNRDPNY
jgi:hypothetical protein